MKKIYKLSGFGFIGYFFTHIYRICCENSISHYWYSPKVSFDIMTKIFKKPIADTILSSIPIRDNQELMCDLLNVNNHRLLPLSDFSEKYKNTYSGWSKVRLGVYSKILKMLEILPENIGVAYFEGFRTLAKQKEYFDKKFLEILADIPDMELAYLETTKHLSPFIDNIPTHATGAAIDITLFKIENNTKILLDMGQFDVIFGPNYHQETLSLNTTLEQRNNRLFLLDAAINAGLANYGFEWWHYSYGDKMYAYLYNEPYAKYGLYDNSDAYILSMTKNNYFAQITKLLKHKSSEQIILV